MRYIYTMGYYSTITINEFMKFTGKWMELKIIILSKETQTQKNIDGKYSTDKWILAPKRTMPMK